MLLILQRERLLLIGLSGPCKAGVVFANVRSVTGDRPMLFGKLTEEINHRIVNKRRKRKGRKKVK